MKKKRGFLLFILLLVGMTCRISNGMSFPISTERESSSFSQTSLPDSILAERLPNKEMLLSSAQSLLSLTEEGGVCTYIPVQHSNSRTQTSFKSPSRLIQNGKIMDVCAFIRQSIHLTNITSWLSRSRYLYTTRRIRV